MIPSLNAILNEFQSAFNLGRTAVFGHSLSIFNLLVALEVCFAGFYVVLGSSSMGSKIAQRVLQIGLIKYFLSNYDYLVTTVVDGFLQIGEEAGGVSGHNIATLNNPDQIVLRGFEIITPGMTQLFRSAQSSWMGIPDLNSIILCLCLLVGMIAIFLIAIQAFVTYLEFLLISSLGLILVPFGIFKPLAYLSERVFGAIIGFGTKLMVLALILGVSQTILIHMQMPDTVTWQSGLHFILVSLALCCLALHAPSIGLALLHGQPSLNASAVAAPLALGMAATYGASKGAAQIAGMASAGFSGASSQYAAGGGGGDSEQNLLAKAARKASQTAVGLTGAGGAVLSGAAHRALAPLSNRFQNGQQSVPNFPGFRNPPPQDASKAKKESA